jgi:glycosyltransferase involved in cell wall biosynthesis
MANNKTILYLITRGGNGGAQRYIFDLADNLKNEFNISVAFGEPGEKGELAERLKQNNINFSIIPHLKRELSPINDILAIFEITKLIKKINPDIIHLNSSKISILGTIALKLINPKSKIPLGLSSGRRQNPKLFYTVHGWVFNEPLSKRKKLFYKYAEKLTARRKDKIICVSEYDRQIAIKEKIAPAEKLTTIYNGMAQIDFLQKENAKKILQSKMQVTNDKLLVASIGNLYKTKDFKNFIRAIAILNTNQKSQITALVIGDGSEKQNLEKLIKELKLENNFFLGGKINNAVQLLSAVDIYVCSSVKEGLPYSILEAMQAGLPIVTTNVGGIPELITNGIEGILVEPQNSDALANAIVNLINNNELGIKLGEAARSKVLQNFTLEEMIKKTKMIYLDQ